MHRKHFGAVFLSVFCLMTQFTAVAAERAALIKGSIVNIRSEANVNSKKVANLFSNTNVTVGDSVKNSNGESRYIFFRKGLCSFRLY